MAGDGRHVYSVYSYIKIDFLSFLELEERNKGMLRLNLAVIYYFLNFYLQLGTKTHVTSVTNNGSHRQGLCGSLRITKIVISDTMLSNWMHYGLQQSAL